jgi:hypothetical protein
MCTGELLDASKTSRIGLCAQSTEHVKRRALREHSDVLYNISPQAHMPTPAPSATSQPELPRDSNTVYCAASIQASANASCVTRCLPQDPEGTDFTTLLTTAQHAAAEFCESGSKQGAVGHQGSVGERLGHKNVPLMSTGICGAAIASFFCKCCSCACACGCSPVQCCLLQCCVKVSMVRILSQTCNVQTCVSL